jgi:tetratricopeptide (TPR) repeat protein
MFENQVDRWQGHLSPTILGRLRDSLEGTIALEEGRFSDAISYLEAALPGGVGETHDFEPLGRAYLGAGEAEKALAVFEKMSQSPDRFSRPIRYVKGLFRLGEAQEKMGKANLARETYRKGLSWWGTADLPLPEIERARKAFKRLDR